MSNYFSFLQLRPKFRSLWLAQVISLTGDWFNTIASVIIVNRYAASGLAIGGLFIARALPPFLLGPVAGVVADRFDRRKVLVLSDLLRAGIVLGFLLVDRPERLWLLYVLTVLQFSVSAFFEPARAALVPALVQNDELLTANTLSSITWSAMLTLGGAIGGLTASLFGVRVSLIVDAVTFSGFGGIGSQHYWSVPYRRGSCIGKRLAKFCGGNELCAEKSGCGAG